MNCTVVIWSLLTHSEHQLFVIVAGNMIVSVVLLDIH